MPRPVTVLHLRDSPWIDGPGRTILETAKRIDRDRVDYQVGVFVSDSATPHPLVAALRSHNLPVHEIRDRGGVREETISTLAELIDRLQADILHTSEFRSNVIGLLCRRRRRIRLVATAHGWIANDWRGRAYSLADRILLRRFDHVILVSHAMRKRLPGWWMSNERVTVLHNALMTESYGRNVREGIPRLPECDGTIRMLNVGRLSPEKGQDLLIRAVSSLASRYPKLQLALAGTGPLDASLRRLVSELGIADRVEFLGYVEDMPAVYASADVVVQSSFTEGLPNVVLEAAYLGVPVVATDVGGTSEVISHGMSGWLVRPRSQAALEAGLEKFIDSRDEFRRMAVNERRRIERDFGLDARTERQARLYTWIGGAVP